MKFEYVQGQGKHKCTKLLTSVIGRSQEALVAFAGENMHTGLSTKPRFWPQSLLQHHLKIKIGLFAYGQFQGSETWLGSPRSKSSIEISFQLAALLSQVARYAT